MKKSKALILMLVLVMAFSIGAGMVAAKGNPPPPLIIEKCDYRVNLEDVCYCCLVRGDDVICKIIPCW